MITVEGINSSGFKMVVRRVCEGTDRHIPPIPDIAGFVVQHNAVIKHEYAAQANRLPFSVLLQASPAP